MSGLGGSVSPVDIDVNMKTFSMVDNSSYVAVEPLRNMVSPTSIAPSASKGSSTRVERVAILLCTICTVVILVATISSCTAFATEISVLKSEATSSHQQSDILSASIEILKQQLNATVEQLKTLDGSIQQLNSSIHMVNSSLGSGRHANVPALSCAALPPSTPSGYYWVRASNGSAVHVYCDMTRSCGGVTGGWMRVAELDMTNSSQHCPSGLRQRSYSSIRTCVIDFSTPGCAVVNFVVGLLHYSKVCGKIRGYQVGSTDSFGLRENANIEQNYVDGISLTHGHPRQHIWTFAAALDEVGTIPERNCPCTNISQAADARRSPYFVGSDYFCDTGSSRSYKIGHFYSDPLWDSAGCGRLNTCCSFNNPPWFYKQLPQPTTDDIEMRVCRDQGNSNEDLAIEIIEVYVQ